MRVTDRGTTLVVQDTPGCVWVFAAGFVVAGTMVVLMFVASNRSDVPWWGKLVAVLLGAAFASVGVIAIRRSPTTRAEFDAASGTVRVRTRAPFGRVRVEEASLADIGIVQVLASRDADGAEQYVLRLLRRDGREIPLHAQASYSKRSIERAAKRIREYLGIAATSHQPPAIS